VLGQQPPLERFLARRRIDLDLDQPQLPARISPLRAPRIGAINPSTARGMSCLAHFFVCAQPLAPGMPMMVLGDL
jgi:hypothetical protein